MRWWSSVTQAVEWLRQGGMLIYPTETLYALGCLATDVGACQAVAQRKGRPAHKPFPVIVADWEMVQEFFFLTEPLLALVRRFWPGPLTVLVSCRRPLAPLVQDSAGWAAVRMTPHPVAAALCQGVGEPLVATSANVSGQPAAARLEAVDRAVAGEDIPLLGLPPWPAGGAPSTVVALEQGQLRVVREGAISRAALAAAGWSVG